MRRTIIIAIAFALALTACGTKVRTTNYHDFETGVSVSIECKYEEWGGALKHDTCRVVVLDDGA